MCQTRAVWSTEPEASLVPVQFHATEWTFQNPKKFTQSRHESKPDLPIKRRVKSRVYWVKPSFCDLDTLCYGDS